MILFGASGHGKVILDILRRRGIEPEAFWDDKPVGNLLMGVPVLQTPHASRAEELILSVGNNRIRQMLSGRFSGFRFGMAIHPSAQIAEDVEIGEGSVVMAGVLINPGSRIGKHVILNTGCVVDHDARIGDFAHISPNATLTGNVVVGEGTHVGAGAVVIPGVEVGKWAVIGAGSVVIRTVPNGAKVVGNPARLMQRSEL
ncbi:acetyltransferase [bacterium]|nr:acetyltransferase [bacterium]